MKRHMLMCMPYWLIVVGLFVLLPCNTLLAQTYVPKAVPSTSPDPIELFQITLTGSTGTDNVVIAKFVVDDTSTDLDFRLEPTDLAKYRATDFKISQGPVALNDDSLAAQVALLRVREPSPAESAATGYRIIKISITFTNNYNFTAPEVWKIKAKKPTAGTLHFWGFWNQGTGETTVEASVTRPKLIEFIADGSGNPDVTNFTAFVDFPTTKNISFGEVHIDINDTLAPREMYQFINVGTQTLDMVSVAPAAPPAPPVDAYIVTNYPGSASDVLPLAAFTGTEFKCRPTSITNPTLGSIPDKNITITINSAVIPELHINLTNNRAIRLNTALLLDLSGSMLTDIHGVGSWDANMQPTNPEDVRKIWHAREAGRLLKEVYLNLLPTGRLGLFTYPNLNGDCPSNQQVVSLQSISSNNAYLDPRLNNASPTRIAPLSDYYLTPMADGIKKVYDSLPRGVQDERNAVVMIGDGQHSCDSSPPKRTPADWEADLRASGMKFYTIPYGDNNASWTQQLKDIATWTGGFSYPVNLLSIFNEGDLRKSHERAIRDILGLETIIDPEGTIGRNQRNSHAVCISQDDYTLTFIARWDAGTANALSVQLQTPGGALITPATAQTSPADVGYFSSGSYAGYVVKGRYLQGRAGVGLWKLQVTGSPSLGTGQMVPYAYSVYAQTRLKTSHKLNLPFAGAMGLFEVSIGDKIHRVRNLAATLEYKVPSRSFGTYLATTSVDPKLILEAPNMINGNKASLADKKYYVLTNVLKKPFDPASRVIQGKLMPSQGQSKELYAKAASEVYSASLTTTQVAGLYELVARIKGVTVNGDCFEREISLSREVALQLMPDLMVQQVKFEPFIILPLIDPDLRKVLSGNIPEGFERKNVVFTPRDKYENYLGPGQAHQIKFAVKDAKPLGSVIDNLDGSYIQVVEYKKGGNPIVSVTAQGVTSPEVPLCKKSCLSIFSKCP